MSKKLSTIYVDSQIFGHKNFVAELSDCIDKIHKAGKSVALRLAAIFMSVAWPCVPPNG